MFVPAAGHLRGAQDQASRAIPSPPARASSVRQRPARPARLSTHRPRRASWPRRAAPDACGIAWTLVLAYAADRSCGRGVRRRPLDPTPAADGPRRDSRSSSPPPPRSRPSASNMFELGEKMRFRLETDPLVLAATAALAALSTAPSCAASGAEPPGPGRAPSERLARRPKCAQASAL